MIEKIVAGLWAGYGLAVPLGAVAVLMVDMTARSSFRVGAAAAMGAVTVDGLYAIAAVTGGSALAIAIQPYSQPLRWMAAIVLIVMAAHIVMATVHKEERTSSAASVRITCRRAYFTFFCLTALNPWPAIYFVSLVLGEQATREMAPSHATAYIAAIVVASASWQLLLAGGGATLGRKLTSDRGRTVTAFISGGLIVALAFNMVV
ncbi:MAG: LysE family transporter [Advenella sp.]|uniref:Lysine transporter LysE n=1 Tax=Advenella kashmirensis TaxID=310575 RepID=A0A356LAG2_9BURK|nr:LysE family transporter [Advenella sp. FME57]HBP28000.1 lysine transporter LysE [Advenella kashmirensis]